MGNIEAPQKSVKEVLEASGFIKWIDPRNHQTDPHGTMLSLDSELLKAGVMISAYTRDRYRAYNYISNILLALCQLAISYSELKAVRPKPAFAVRHQALVVKTEQRRVLLLLEVTQSLEGLLMAMQKNAEIGSTIHSLMQLEADTEKSVESIIRDIKSYSFEP